MEAFIIIALWLLLGWLGYRIVCEWWIFEFDLTRKERNGFRLAILAGPCLLITGVILYFLDRPSDPRSDEIIRPRKDT
jgi:hypothetical protein